MLSEHLLVSRAVASLQKNNMDEIIVVDDMSNPVGMVTDEDILTKVGESFVNPNKTTLSDIMRFPIISINENSTLEDALKKMRENNVRKLVTLSNSNSVTGLIRMHTIANLLKNIISQPKSKNSPIRSILGNLGIVIQFAGILMLVPAILAIVLNDSQSATAIFFMTMLMLITGFFLNSYGERYPLKLYHMAVFTVLSFSLLVIFGMIPYLYLNLNNVYSLTELISSSFFSSSTAFTTTGLTLFPYPETLPQSMTFFSAFCHFVGGLSFIYLIMTAFYSETRLRSIVGIISGKNIKFRESLVTITIIFSVYATIIAVSLYYFGERDIIDNFSLAMSALATGGLVPNSQILNDLVWQEYVILIAGMVLGALPISFHYEIFKSKLRSAVLTREILVYFMILGIAVVAYNFVTNYDLVKGIFTVISASSTTGLQMVDLNQETSSAIVILTLLMFIGGCGFSTAGGLKVFRLLYLLKIKTYLKNIGKLSNEDKKHVKTAIILLVLFPALPLISAIHLYSQGHDFMQSYFESTAAITSGGLTVGVTSESLDDASKIILGVLMIVGRLEIIMLLAIFVPKLL